MSANRWADKEIGRLQSALREQKEVSRAMDDKAEEQKARIGCGECSDYAPDSECGVCGARLCVHCSEPISGEPVISEGDEERLTYCSEECRDGAAERTWEVLYGQRR